MCKHLDDEKISQAVELLEDGYAINGCCGGGCFVIAGIRYCPFCGEKLFNSKSDKGEDYENLS